MGREGTDLAGDVDVGNKAGVSEGDRGVQEGEGISAGGGGGGEGRGGLVVQREGLVEVVLDVLQHWLEFESRLWSARYSSSKEIEKKGRAQEQWETRAWAWTQ